jgi:hypothetical protein
MTTNSVEAVGDDDGDEKTRQQYSTIGVIGADPSQSKHLETATMKIEVAVPTTRTTTITMTEGRLHPNLQSARRACRYWTRVDRTAAFMLHCVCPPLPRRRR